MARYAAGSFRRRISRLRLRTRNDDLRCGPSTALLDLLAKLDVMSKEQLYEVKNWRDGIGDQFGARN